MPARSLERNARLSTTAAFVGTAIEWYDFFIFGTAAALVFGQVFYPEASPGSALMASFATFWVGFLARPIGGVVFGHLGDRLGRKNTLVVTLVMMGAATTCIGLLPTYATWGIAAPACLVALRAVQGIAVGGEWGGAVVLATESSSEERKGRAGMWVQQGSPVGSILSTVVFILVGQLDDADFLSWGWRIPFLVSAVLVLVGLLIRLQVEESEEFQQVKDRSEDVRVPLAELFRVAPLVVLLSVGASVMGIANAYFNNTFTLAWATNDLGIERQTILNILLVGAIAQFLWQPVAARLSIRHGMTRVMVFGLVFCGLMIVPKFMALISTQPVPIVATLILSTMGSTAYYAMLATFLAGAFPANVRYTGVSVAYQLCATLIGGATPLIGQAILNSTGGSPWAVAGFYASLLLITAVSVVALSVHQTRKARDLASQGATA